MAQTAEGLAEQYAVTREEADQVAVNSQQRASAAWDAGRYDAEVSPVTVRTRKGETGFAVDEHMRPGTTLEGLARLRPYFGKDGLVTAGNASGSGDGAASVVLTSRAWAEANGAKPIARLVSWGFAGVDPRIMGIGPAPAARAALAAAGLTLEDMDLVEINEAFAAQYKSVEKELGLDPERTNVNGGAIAITHPLAASGAQDHAPPRARVAPPRGEVRARGRVHRGWAGRGGDRRGLLNRRADPGPMAVPGTKPQTNTEAANGSGGGSS